MLMLSPHLEVHRAQYLMLGHYLSGALSVSADTECTSSAWFVDRCTQFFRLRRTPLHKALYWGHVQLAAVLLAHNASTYVPDDKQRTPLEVAAEELRAHLHFSKPGDVYAWGSGANYQLGTGSTERHSIPMRIEALQTEDIVAIAAAKFHTCALTKQGQLWTWGWGRGGRLGHAGFDGDVQHQVMAQIHPCVVAGLSRQRIVAVAAAKHHTLACSAEGNVFAWGSNKHGRLGFSGADSVHTPRRVGNFKHEIATVATANKHSAALTPSGKLYTWGDNTQGQLGYGTSGRACNAIPRIVESVMDREIAAVSMSKRHTVVLTHDGDVLTWGHKVCKHLLCPCCLPDCCCTCSVPDLCCCLVNFVHILMCDVLGHARTLPYLASVVAALGLRLTADWRAVSLCQVADCSCRCMQVVPPAKVHLHGRRDTARSAKALRLLTSADRRDGSKAASTVATGVPGMHAHARGAAATQVQAHAPRPLIHFHRDNADVTNPRIVAIAAGAAHTSMLTASGVVLAYRSTDPGMVAQEVEGILGHKCVVKIAAGKTRTVALTDTGEVYSWEADQAQHAPTGAAQPSLPGFDRSPVCTAYASYSIMCCAPQQKLRCLPTHHHRCTVNRPCKAVKLSIWLTCLLPSRAARCQPSPLSLDSAGACARHPPRRCDCRRREALSGAARLLDAHAAEHARHARAGRATWARACGRACVAREQQRRCGWRRGRTCAELQVPIGAGGHCAQPALVRSLAACISAACHAARDWGGAGCDCLASHAVRLVSRAG